MSADLLSANVELLDISLDDIEDLAGFDVPWPGEYVLEMTADIKEVNDATCVELSYEVVECLKKNEDSDPDTPAGTKFSQLFALTGAAKRVDMAKKFLKQTLKGIAEDVGEGNLLVLIRDHLADGMRVAATVGRRKDKEDPERVYAKVSNVRVYR